MLAHLVGDGTSIEFRTRLVRRPVLGDSLHVRLRFVVIEEPLHSGVVPTWRESMSTIWARPTVAKPNATAARAPSVAKLRPQRLSAMSRTSPRGPQLVNPPQAHALPC